ncbi:MAG TPA: LamG-like jellyroll fold domain-containing protein [Pirellulales bacterium]|nr:LamG-like jellyroll fold domain-containing protein [Pirellulales bacterium]
MKSTLRVVAKQTAWIAGFSLAIALGGKTLRAAEPDAETRAGWQKLAQQGEGFVIWESNRTGRWRIFRRELDGSNLRQISPEEKGREHYCPHLSPDGTRLVYLSYPVGTDTYDHRPPQAMPLYLLSSEGGKPKLLSQARDYFEDRAAVWIDNDHLAYIDGEGFSCELDLRSGKSTRLTANGMKGGNWGQGGYLINATKTHATGGQPTFSIYDAAKRTVAGQSALGGCQPYFTHDGRWGFWMGGAGGPINRIELATRQVSPIIALNDPRMPKDRAYLYFPMISRDGRFFTFAASPNQHDHFKSDYDVFVARLDPGKLEIIDRPVRYTFDAKNDRFPDVHVAEFALGQFAGESPFTAALAVKGSNDEWDWDLGDGATARGRKAKHTYPKPGEYRVTARHGQRTLRGLVRVLPAAPPKPLSAWLAKPNELVVAFDEPIRIEPLQARLESGLKIAEVKRSDNGRELVLALADKLTKRDVLHLSGLTDAAQKPNALAPTRLEVAAAGWPAQKDGLVYLFQTADQPNLSPSADGQPRSYTLNPRARARLNGRQGLVLTGGAYLVSDADSALLEACRRSGQMTIEAFLRPDHLKQQGPARIVTFSSSANERNFTLGQQDDRLILRLRTPATGVNGVNPEVALCRLDSTAPRHVAVSYRPGELVCYLDGKEVDRSRDVQGDFSNWSPQHLLFGDEWDGARDWAGALEGVAIFSRALGAEEIRRDATQYRHLVESSPAAQGIAVEAELVARSPLPTMEEIKPYRSALAVYKYRVVGDPPQALAGERELLVAHWALLDGQPEPIGGWQPGKKVRLALELVERNAQLQRYVTKDAFDSDDDLARPRYYDVRP